MKMEKCFGVVLVVAILAGVYVCGAKFWETKEFTDWSEKECKKFLTKSPWAFSESFRRSSNIGSSQTGVRETTEIMYFRLVTATPIRMAFARLQLLQDPANEALKVQLQDYLAAPPGDEILIQISYKVLPASSGNLLELHSFFGHATLATFTGKTLLSSSEGVNVPISNYLPWNSERPNAVLVFPRHRDNGEDYFSGSEKSISLRSEFDTDSRKYRISVRMKPKDMMFDGQFTL